VAMGASRDKQKRNRILSWIINLSGVLVFALILYMGGVEAWKQIAQADWRYVLLAFGATLLWNLVAAFRWALIAEQLSDQPTPCPFRYYFTYQMIGMLIGQVVPITVGMLGGRPAALSLSHGVPFRRAALSVFLDKAFDLLLALLVAVPAVLYLAGWVDLPPVLGLIGGLLIVALILLGWQYEATVQRFGRTASRLAQPLVQVPVIGRRLVRRFPEQLERLATGSFVPNSLAVRAFFLTVVMYSLLSVRLFFIAQALRLDIPWYLLALGASVAQLALIFSVTPGSLGFLEGGWAAVLGLGGLSQVQFLYFVIGRRAFVLVFTLIDTLLAFAWIRESPAHLFRAVLQASRQPEEPSPERPPTEADPQA
jgi:uncharacterized protein (TIRG00374 family)